MIDSTLLRGIAFSTNTNDQDKSDGDHDDGNTSSSTISKSDSSSVENSPSPVKHKKKTKSKLSHRGDQQARALSEHSQELKKQRRVENSQLTMATTRSNRHENGSNDGGGKKLSSKEFAKLEKEKAQKDKENEQLLQEKELLEQQIRELSKKRKNGSGGGRPSKSGSQNDALMLLVKTKTKGSLWRTCKFVANEQQLERVCRKICLDTDEGKAKFKELSEEEFDDYVIDFTDLYGKMVLKDMNEQRNSVQQALKKVWLEARKEGLHVKSKDLLTVILREDLIDPEGEPGKFAQNRELFAWYWDKFVGKVAGHENWGPSIKYHGLMCSHAPPDEPSQKYVTSSTEALALLMVENCEKKWRYVAKCKEDGVEVDKEHKNYVTRYTDSKAGQCKYGGWNGKGRKRFSQLLKEIMAARRSEEGEIAEKACLKALRQEQGLEKGGKSSKKSKKKDALVNNIADLETLEEESDEEEAKLNKEKGKDTPKESIYLEDTDEEEDEDKDVDPKNSAGSAPAEPAEDPKDGEADVGEGAPKLKPSDQLDEEDGEEDDAEKEEDAQPLEEPAPKRRRGTRK